MIYLVSGWLRHGTSMMMGCLQVGGLGVIRSEVRDRQAAARWHDGAYIGNDGYFELTADELNAPDFPLAYEGKAVKCLRHQVLTVPAHAYRIIYMRRDGEETRQSMQALMGQRIPRHVADMVNRETGRIVGILRQRRDVALVEVPYRGVIENPRAWFDTLARAGWPINPEAAATHVDPSRLRYRRERLTEGA